jgi:hypothetical protein
MSQEAVKRRLQEVSDLYNLYCKIKTAKIKKRKADEGTEQDK